MYLFSILDLKTKSYGRPFPAPHSAVAIREITNSISDPSHPFSRFPSDFELYQLGSMVTETGVLIPEHRFIASISSIAAAAQPESLRERRGSEVDNG